MNKRTGFSLLVFILIVVVSLILNMGGCKKKENSPTEQVVQKETNQAPATSEKCIQLPALKDNYPVYHALNEKDVKLIEAFIHEMNLLDAVKFLDSRVFEEQLARVKAAGSDLRNLGSSNPSMGIMGLPTIRIELMYESARLAGDSSNFQKQEYESKLDKASQSRENFLEAYRTVQHGATNLEVKKLFEVCHWEVESEDESTSK